VPAYGGTGPFGPGRSEGGLGGRESRGIGGGEINCPFMAIGGGGGGGSLKGMRMGENREGNLARLY